MFNNQQYQDVSEQPRFFTKFGEPNNQSPRTQTRIETTSNVDGASDSEDEVSVILFNEEHGSSGRTMQTMSNYVNVATSNLEPPSDLNAVVAINRLPVELLTHIIILASLEKTGIKHPYLTYTWVCRYWRFVVIHNPVFWTTIQLESDDALTDPFVQEFLRRSGSLELDVIFSPFPDRFPSYFEKFVAEQSNCDRIRNLWLQLRNDSHVVSLFSGRRFPALRGLAYPQVSFGLLSVIDASNYLETLRCTLWGPLVDRLGHIFARIRNLQLTVPFANTAVSSVLSSLHYNTNLRNLILVGRDSGEIDSSFQTILPELQFLSSDHPSLLKNIRAPSLSGLHLRFTDRYDSRMEMIPEVFDYSSIKYLYVLDGERNTCSILGLKERMHSTRFDLLTPRTKNFIECSEDIISLKHIKSVEDVFSINDILSDTCPRDCFCFVFDSLTTFEGALGKLLCPLLSRMKNLTELYLLSRALVLGYEGTLSEILSVAPSVEKAVVQYGHRLTDFIRPLNDTSLCPRLEHLSYITAYMGFIPREDVEDHAEDVGKMLTECLRWRQSVYGDKLKYIALEQCPPLPITWLRQLQALGVTVVTAKNVESVLESRGVDDESRFKK